MKHVCELLLLLAAVSMLAEQQGTPPSPSSPPASSSQPSPGEPIPPDRRASLPRHLTDAEVQQEVQAKLASEPLLENLQLRAKADPSSIVVMGNVDNEQQHRLALRIAESYRDKRRIIDKIKIAADHLFK